jgi:hypothetical protein
MYLHTGIGIKKEMCMATHGLAVDQDESTGSIITVRMFNRVDVTWRQRGV